MAPSLRRDGRIVAARIFPEDAKALEVAGISYGEALRMVARQIREGGLVAARHREEAERHRILAEAAELVTREAAGRAAARLSAKRLHDEAIVRVASRLEGPGFRCFHLYEATRYRQKLEVGEWIRAEPALRKLNVDDVLDEAVALIRAHASRGG